MTELSKLLQLLLLTPTLLVLLAVGDLFYFRSRHGWLAKLALALFLFGSLPLCAEKLMWMWEKGFPVLQGVDVENFAPQAIVVIGGGLDRKAREYGSNPTVKPNTLLRLRYAATLARQTGLPVLASGGPTLSGSPVSEAEVMADILKNEYRLSTVWQESDSMTTLENARFSRQVLQQLGMQRIILVTQAYHMPRAAMEFRKVGFQVLPGPTAFLGSATSTASLALEPALWLPSIAALNICFLLIHETVGMLWYILNG